MSSQISEGNDAALQKRIRQAVYDIRYKARKEELDLRHAYSQYIGKSGLDQTGKEAVQNKLFGKSQQQESKVFESAGSNRYKVRVTDDETGKTYIRFAKRGKINKLRSKGSVEMTGHGSPKGGKNAPSVKKADRKVKLSPTGPAPKKPTKATAKAGIKIKEKPPVLKVEPSKMETKKSDPVGSAVQALRKVVRKEAFIADAAAIAPPTNKKITGEKVDNSKLIKVFPQDGSDPQIGSIKSSYKPVGEVVAEIVYPQQVDEVVGQALGGLVGATAGKDLAAKGLTKVAGALTKAGAPKAIGKALTSKAAPKIAGAAVGSAAGEVLDPFKKNKDKNPVAAAAGGAAGGAIHSAIKSSYKPVGQVVAEILANEDMNKGYEVTNADKKGNTPAWQGYLAGKKKKDGTPLYRKAAHMEEIEAVKPPSKDENIKGQWPFKNTQAEDEGDDGTGRSMYSKWNNAKNRLRSMGLKMNYDLEGDQLIEDAVEYFYEQGITEETIDLIVEEVGLDDFTEFVLDPHQDLVEARSARKAKANAPSYEKVKASVDASDAAKKKAGKGEYSKTYAKRSGETEDSTNYNDKPAAKKVAKKKAKPVATPAKKAATKKKVTTVVKKVAKKDFDGDGKKESPKAEYKGSKDKAIKKAVAKKEGLRGKIAGFVKRGVERHKAATKKASSEIKKIKKVTSDTAKKHSQHRKDFVKGLTEEERLRASGKFTEEEIEAILEASQYDELDNELLQIVEDNLGVKNEDEILELMESGWHRRNPGKKHPLESGSYKPTPSKSAGDVVLDAAKKSSDKEDRMYVAMRRVKDRQKNYSKAKSDAADKLHGEYTSRQSKIKKGASPKEAAAQSHGDFGGKGFNIKRGGRGRKGFHGPGTDRGTGNKAARRAGQEVRDTRVRKEHHQLDANGKVIEHGDGTPSSVEEGKLKSAVGSAVGTVGGVVAGGLAGGVTGAKLGAIGGSALGSALGAKKGRKGSAAVGGAVAGPVGAAIGASYEPSGNYVCESTLVRDILSKKN